MEFESEDDADEVRPKLYCSTANPARRLVTIWTEPNFLVR